MQSTIELELARMKVIQTDYGLLDAFYLLTTHSPESISVLARHHPQLMSICKDLEMIIDLFNGDTAFDENTVKVLLINILGRLRQVGEYLSVTGEYITNLSVSVTESPSSTQWTDDNLLKKAYDFISEFMERLE